MPALLALALLALGAFLPVTADAAVSTYYWQINSGTTLGGVTTNWNETCGTYATSGGPSWITTMSTTASTCATHRVYNGLDASTTPLDMLLMVKPTPFASATIVTGQSTGSLWTLRYAVTFRMILGYVDATGFHGMGSVDQTAVSTTTTYTANLSTIGFTAPAGSYLAVKIQKVNTGTTTGRIYLNNTTGTGAYGIRVAVDETLATGDTTPPVDGATFTATPVSPTQIDLAWSAATDNVALHPTTPYKLVRANGATPPADCSGTALFYGNDLTYNDTGRTAMTQYSYRVCAYDSSFNVSTGKTASATTLDSSAPTAGTVNVTPLVSTFTTASPTITAAFTDNQTAVTSCQYTVNGGLNWSAGVLSGSAPTWTCTANPTGLSGTLAINMRATSQGGTTTATEVTANVDNTAPTTTASATGYTFGNWTATSPLSVTLSSTDLQSGVAASNPKYCTDTTNTCSPTTTYSVALSLTCAAGSNCTQYVRTQATDNLNNVSTVGSNQVRQDRLNPTDGATFTAVPNGSTQINLAWSAGSDSGSGLNATAAYKVVKAAGAAAPANCASGTTVYTGNALSTTDPGLTPGSQWSYRLCVYDDVNNVSTGRTATATTSAGCTRVAPNISITEGSKTITSPGGLVSYNVRVTNNDNVSCGPTTFNLSATNTNATDFAASIPASIDLEPGSFADVSMAVSHISALMTASTQNTARVSSAAHSQVTSNSVTTNITLQWQIQKCSDCHAYPPKDAVDGADAGTDPERDNPKGAVFGAHAAHVIASDNAPAPAGKLDCTDCHAQTWANLTDFGHADGFIDMAPAINGGSYVPGNGRVNPMPQRPDLTAADMGTCNNTACHADASPLWYNPAAFTVACDSCHGQPPSGSVFPDLNGSHQSHWNQTVEGGEPINACSRCHASAPTLGNLWLPPHLNGTSDQSCSSTICHNTGLVAAGSNPNPVWGVGNADCGWCHGNPPSAPLSKAADHTGVPGTTGCNNCHTHSGTGSPATHINGAIDFTTMNCTKCHQMPPNSTPTNTAPNRNGSHTSHYTTTMTTAVAWDCTTANCHVKPGPTDYSHANGATAQTCSVSQCHNNTLVITVEALGSNPNPVWGVGNANCGWCHGNPPVNSTKYNHGAASGTCNECHGHNGSGATHLNGAIDTAAMNCWSCHGDQISKSYPPRAVNGADGIGAHVKHMEGTASVTSPAVACADCHTIPSDWRDGHYQTAYPADVTMANSTKAKFNGASPVFVPELLPANGTGGTCSATYCHGANMPGGSNNGADTTPAWTATSTGCNFCHGTPPNSGTHSGSEVFPGDCAGCHPDTMNAAGAIINTTNHMNGVAQGRCDGCHEYPPTSNAHTTHVNVILSELGLPSVPSGYIDNPVCGVCHNATANEWHPGSTLTNGNLRNIFQPDAGANPQQVVYQFGISVPAYDAQSKTCSNVSCHLGDSMAWGDVAANSCDNCHAQNGRTHTGQGENVTLHGLGGAPSGHAVFLFAQGCSDCHPHDGLGSAGSSGHINGVVEFGGARMPSASNPSFTGDYGLNTSCTNLCHNNAGGNRWAAGTLVGCEDCHAATGKLLYVSSGFSGWPPVSAKHAKHNANTAYVPNTCNQCHGDGATEATRADHRDGHTDTFVDYNPTQKTCNTNTCHYANKPYQPGVYDGDWSANGVLACNECHGAAGRTLNQGNYPPTSAKHQVHMNASTTYVPTDCDDCHGANATTGEQVGHKNGVKETPLDYNPVDFSCATNTCHVGNRSNLWTTGATLNCDDCHGSAAAGKTLKTTLGLSAYPPTTGTHTLHINANPAYMPTDCDSCHGAGYTSFSGATSDPATHINGALNNVVSYVPASQTCTNTCHVANQTNSWTVGVLNCQNCHSSGYIGGGANMPSTGLHVMTAAGVQKHDQTLGAGCTACHEDYSTRPASHLNGVFLADNSNNTDRFLLASVGYVDGATNAGTCSGSGLLSCHTDKGAWSRLWSTAADSTASTVGDPRCNVCHGQANNWRTGVSPSHSKNGINDTAAHNQCAVCHVTGAAPYVWGTHHENNLIEFNNNAEVAYSTAAGNCNSSCHSNDAPHTMGVSPNFVNTNGLAGTTPPNCNYCHGYPPNPGYVIPPGSDGFAYQDAPVSEGKGAHTVHVNKLSALSGYAVDPALARTDKYGLGRNASLCGTCHSNTNHALNSRIIDFNGTTSYRFATTPSSQTYDGTAGVSSGTDFKSCSNLNCHYGTSPGWQDPAQAGQ